MADTSSKTEKPTPKRRREAVKQGQVSRAPDLAAWAGLLALTFFIPGVFDKLSEQLAYLLKTIPDLMSNPNMLQVQTVLVSTLKAVALAVLPLLLGVLMVSIIAGVSQGGARPYLSRLAFKGSRISPATGAKRILGPQGAWELVKQILKMSTIGVVLWVTISRTTDLVMGSGSLPLSILASSVANDALRLVRIVIAVGLIIAVADYFVSRRRVTKQIMMSRKEIMDEMKQSDGDPMLKATRRQRALQMARSRMMQDEPLADVILVNPTHVAVALKYTAGSGAPKVVAKGAGAIASKIRDLATEHRVPMVQDIPLARSLYRNCEVGQEIPKDLYTAVARILAFVMALKRRGAAAGMHRAEVVDQAIAR